MKVSHSFKRLLTSQTRLKLINIFFYTPENIYYVRELVRATGEEINSVRRELLNLETAAILSKEIRGNRLYYWANPGHYLFYDLIVLANKHAGLGASLQENHLKLGRLKALFYSQDFLHHISEPGNSVDLVIVGDISLKLVDEYVKVEESKLGREINYMVMDQSELRLRLNKRDPIMVEFFTRYPALIIGVPQDIYK